MNAGGADPYAGQPIRLTAEHIRKGIKGDPCWCAVVFAIKAAFPAVEYVRVTLEGITIEGIKYDTPANVRMFMYRFDCPDKHRSVDPIEFELPPMRIGQ